MSGFSNIPLFAAIVAASVAIAGVSIAVQEHHQVVDQQAKLDHQARCITALGAGDGRAVSGDGCDPVIVLYFNRAQAASTCDQALALGGTAPECSAVVAQVAGANVLLKSQLTAAVADRDAAIARAEKRAVLLTQRKAQDAEALAHAPRQPDGFIVCDTLCLRARFEAGGPDGTGAEGNRSH